MRKNGKQRLKGSDVMKKRSNINIRIDDDLLKQIDRIQMEHFFQVEVTRYAF